MAPTSARRRHILFPMGGLALSALACGSCATKAPEFAVFDIEIAESTPDATILSVTMLGENSNKDPIPLYEISYTMTIDGQVVERARRSPEVTLPAQGAQEFVFPVAVPTSVMDVDRLTASEYRLTGSVMYILPGTIAELFFDNNIRRPSQGFAESGSFAPDSGPQPPTTN